MIFGVSKLNDMYAKANTITQGRMIRRGGKRSSSIPMPGENTATVIAAMPNALGIASLCQPKALDSGARNRLNV